MNKTRKLVSVALAGIAVAALESCAVEESHKADDNVKCYGVAKAGMNDCATGSTSCAGTAKMDAQGDAFIAIPKGICEKLARAGIGEPVKTP